jgi:benzoyl-CoA reductase/2-hydroxyglutaryl-CoA dehydratase subunit BcrC/BadD/HgdB
VLRRGEHLWPEDHLAELRRAGARLRPEPVQRLAPVLVTGIVPEPGALLPLLTSAGMVVVADDWAAVGRRVARTPPPRAADPWDDLVDRYLALPPCSTRSADAASRVAYLVGLAARSGARGAILHSMKFCEPELFDLPAIRRALTDRGLPVLELETELEAELPAQAVTRLEAFGELLAARRRPT